MVYVILSKGKIEGKSLWLRVCSAFPKQASSATRQILVHIHPTSISLLVQKAENRGIKLIYVLKPWEPTIAVVLPIQARHICRLFFWFGASAWLNTSPGLDINQLHSSEMQAYSHYCELPVSIPSTLKLHLRAVLQCFHRASWVWQMTAVWVFCAFYWKN